MEVVDLAAWPLGYDPAPASLAALGIGTVGMAALGLALYRRRADRQEVTP